MKYSAGLICVAAFTTSLVFTGSVQAEPPGRLPILLLANDSHFGSFTGEILKTEGFNEFQVDSLSDPGLSSGFLQRFDLVVLTENALTAAQQQLFTRYVNAGGNLIAFKPDERLREVFGIGNPEGNMKDAYIRIDTTTETGKGISSITLQTHGSAALYRLNGAREIARLYSNGISPTPYPAVVENDFGHGHAMAFLYNLPRSIVMTRQGNDRLAGQEKDGITGIRAMDMFTGGWVDTTKNILNQADEQMRLLSHGIEKLGRYKKPLPRFWYFPDTLKCLVTLNNDGEDNREAEFQPQFADVDAKGVKMTLYVKETDRISPEWIHAWKKRGFEISGHADDTRQATDPDWNTMDSVYKSLIGRLENSYGIAAMYTVVNHWFVWCGKNADGSANFAAQAEIEAQNGMGLDCNYAHYDNFSNQGHFLGAMGTNQGNYTGSGLIMKFSNPQGRIINIYQQLNNVYDQQYMEHKDQAGYFNCFRGLMDRSLDGEVYSFICVKAHNAEYFFSKVPLMKMLDYAAGRSVPVWTEERLLGFLRAREEARFSGIRWAEGLLTFHVSSSIKNDQSLGCMIPYRFNGKEISNITVNGAQAFFIVRKIKGFEYSFLMLKAGSNYEIGVHYSN